jgi:hypothetical protein
MARVRPSTIQSGHEKISAWGWSEYENDPSSMSPYGTTWLVRHLVVCRRWNDLIQLLSDPLFLAKRRQTDIAGNSGVSNPLGDILYCLQAAPDAVIRSHQTGFTEGFSLLVTGAKALVLEKVDLAMLRLCILFKSVARSQLSHERLGALYRGYKTAFPGLNRLMQSGYLHDGGIGAAVCYASEISDCARELIDGNLIEDESLKEWLAQLVEADPLS